MAISEPWVRINGQLQGLHNFQEKFGQLELNFEAL